jgi:cytochrome c553
MNEEAIFSRRNRWFVWSVAGVLGLLLLGLAVGFVWMPYRTEAGGSLWDAICRAAGVARPSRDMRDTGRPSVISSDVIVIPNMIAADKLSIGRGATLALRCSMCHGARGMSEADTPNLAGQDAVAIYKQLRDLQSGKRKSEIMAPHARNLSDQDMRDLAAYYAYLPRTSPPPSLTEQLQAPAIVQTGAPMRNIAPCISCHGGSDRKAGTPTLDGEPEHYIRTQLQRFARGERDNDINEQMRNIARQMTPEEIETVVRYYARR